LSFTITIVVVLNLVYAGGAVVPYRYIRTVGSDSVYQNANNSAQQALLHAR